MLMVTEYLVNGNTGKTERTVHSSNDFDAQLSITNALNKEHQIDDSGIWHMASKEGYWWLTVIR